MADSEKCGGSQHRGRGGNTERAEKNHANREIGVPRVSGGMKRVDAVIRRIFCLKWIADGAGARRQRSLEYLLPFERSVKWDPCLIGYSTSYDCLGSK